MLIKNKRNKEKLIVNRIQRGGKSNIKKRTCRGQWRDCKYISVYDNKINAIKSNWLIK